MENKSDKIVIPSSHKAIRGFSSSLDISDTFILTFNGSSVFLRPHKHPHQSLILNHSSDVSAARFSHDGRLLASIDSRGTLIISEPLIDRIIEVYRYEGVYPNAKSLDWSADKKKVCVCGQIKGKYAKIVSIDTGIAADIGTISAPINSCSFRPQRPYKLVMGGDEYQLKCYDGPPYSYVKSHRSHTGFINHVRYSPKGSYIVSGGADRKLVVYDGKSYEVVAERNQAHGGSIFGVDWIDDQNFVTVSSDKVVKIWNCKLEEKARIQTATPQQMKNIKNFGLFLVAVKVFNNNIYVATIDGDIKIYSNPLHPSHKQSSALAIYSGARSKIIKILYPTPTSLILLDRGGRVLNYNLKDNQILVQSRQIQMNPILNGFVSDGKLFVLTVNGIVWVYDISQQSSFKMIKKIDSLQFKMISHGSNNDCQFLGIVGNKLLLFNINQQKIIRQIVINDEISCLQSNNQFVVVGNIKGKARIFNYQFKQIGDIALGTFKITSISLLKTANSNNSYRCLIGDSCGSMAMVLLTENGVEIVKGNMGGHTSVITAADSDGKKLWTFSMDGKVSVWDYDSLTREGVLKDIFVGGILDGKVVGDGLAVAGDDMAVRIIDKNR